MLSGAFESRKQQPCSHQIWGKGAGLKGTCDHRPGGPGETGDGAGHQSIRGRAGLATEVIFQKDGGLLKAQFGHF